ncbi:unnamed protein product [Parnassius mnemosyne]|uniref:Uncharacterized protein n=1 Tax=Parnassius mnemosyne TaxID=213953 RepID=A0AAV1LVV9_9NEOP
MEYACSESSASASRKRPATNSGTGSSESCDSDGTGDSSFTTVNSKRNGKRAAKNRTLPVSAAPAAPSTSAAPAAASAPAAPAAAPSGTSTAPSGLLSAYAASSLSLGPQKGSTTADILRPSTTTITALNG